MRRSEIEAFKKRGLAAVQKEAERLGIGSVSIGDRSSPPNPPGTEIRDPKGVGELREKDERAQVGEPSGDEDDGRTLWVDYDEQGRRYKSFR
eukprot:4497012-Pyramimonas_sp.AAC.1